jgi:hypothetical protein
VTEQEWGRVDTDGTVYVRTSDGERSVGQYPGASETEALAYFGRKYEELKSQVDLLEQRLRAGQVSPTDAQQTLRRLAETIPTANAVGDLEGLNTRVGNLVPLAEERKQDAERARTQAKERAVTIRTALVEEAEQIAETEPSGMAWKTAGDRLRQLFEDWRTQQRESRLDKHTEDELWRRFSHARTAFDRKRRQYFGALDEQRAGARSVKEDLVRQAESLSTSTDWGSTAAAYRDLMDRWRSAGRASRKDDDELWARFRAAQESFFNARNDANSQAEATFQENLQVKEKLLEEAEGLLPISDLTAARSALRDIQERWDAAGKVPRADINRIEGRLRRVEQAVRESEEERWARSNPEARARAEGAVSQLEQTIAGLSADLERARAKGDQRAVHNAEQALEARQEWLAQARQSLAEFSG